MTRANSFKNARIMKAGLVGGWDEAGHTVFVVERTRRRQALYGEYIEIFEPNGNDFNIEIGMFGFTYAEMVGSPEARQHFSLEERWMAEQLIRSFFTNPSNVMRGYTAGVRFLGGVRFRPGWIIQKSPDREGWP